MLHAENAELNTIYVALVQYQPNSQRVLIVASEKIEQSDPALPPMIVHNFVTTQQEIAAINGNEIWDDGDVTAWLEAHTGKAVVYLPVDMPPPPPTQVVMPVPQVTPDLFIPPPPRSLEDEIAELLGAP